MDGLDLLKWLLIAAIVVGALYMGFRTNKGWKD
jgi:hypothetical protein